MAVYLNKESLGPNGLPVTNDVEDDPHDIKVFTRLPVWAKVTTFKSTNASQRGCAVYQQYDSLRDARLLERQRYRRQLARVLVA